MTEESFGIYLDTRTRDNVLSPETFAVAFSAHNEALQAAREMMLADCAGNLGKNIDEFNAARGQAREMMRTGRLKAPSDRELLESLKKENQRKTAECLSAVNMAGIESTQVEWLVQGLIPRGELSVLGADGGTGKGLWQAQLIAHVTTARASNFFTGSILTPYRVLIFSGEDDPAKVLRPRMLAAGADVGKVFVETSDGFFRKNGCLLSIDSELMSEIIRNTAPDLVIVDPYQAFLPMDVKMAERNQMRGVTTPLRAVLRETNSAGLLVAHSNKKGSVAGRQRLADSADLWDAARCVIMMGRDRMTKQVYVSNEKNSYAPECPTTLFTIEGATVEGVKTAVAVYQGTTDKKDYDFIMDKPTRPAATKDEAKEAIISVLKESPLCSMESDKLRFEVMGETGCSERTYKRARSELKEAGNIDAKQIRQKDGVNKWYTFYRGDIDGPLGK